jgi:hypothetical protein
MTHASVGEWCARDPGQFALPESLVRVVALLFACASFGGSPPGHLRFSRFRAALTCKYAPHVADADPPRLTRLDEPFPTEHPRLTFHRHLRAPLRGSSPRSQLIARAVTGSDATFTRESEPPGARPVRSMRSYDPERLPS